MNRPRLGFGANGFGEHTLSDALAVLANLGYQGVAITLDRRHLDPYAEDLPQRLATLRKQLAELGLAVVIETGGRYLIDPWHQHQPTLLSDHGAELRLELLIGAVRIAADLNAEAMSFASGAAPSGVSENASWDRLVSGCHVILAEAEELGVTVGFTPEPGMFVDTLDRYDELVARLGPGNSLGLTLDIGHCHNVEAESVADCLWRAAPRLVNVRIADARRGVPDHVEFGDGEIDFPPVLDALDGVRLPGLLSVELPRYSHAAPDVAQRSLRFLRQSLRDQALLPDRALQP